MEEKTFVILEYLAEQGKPVSFSEFPNSFLQHFNFSDSEIFEHTHNLALLNFVVFDNQKNYIFFITEAGKNALKVEVLAREKKNEMLRDEATKLKFEARTAKFTYYTYWLAFASSIAGLIISLIAILKKSQ